MQQKWESALQRTNKAFREWLRNHIAVQPLSFFLPGIGTMLASLFIPTNASLKWAALYGFIGGLVGLGLLYLGVYMIQLIRATYLQRNEARKCVDKLEAQIEPQLEIMEPIRLGAINSPEGTWWSLKIKNTGTEPAEGCHARLEQITTESSYTLSEYPVYRDLHWAGQEEGVHEFSIPGQHTARLNIIYFGTDKPGSITLAHRGAQSFRLLHELTSLNVPILLLLNITNKGKLAQYVVIRIDLEALAANLLIEPEDRPVCKILWQGRQKRNLSEFRKNSQDNNS